MEKDEGVEVTCEELGKGTAEKKLKKVEVFHTIADVPNDTSFEAVFRNVFLGLLYKMRKL